MMAYPGGEGRGLCFVVEKKGLFFERKVFADAIPLENVNFQLRCVPENAKKHPHSALEKCRGGGFDAHVEIHSEGDPAMRTTLLTS